MKSLSLVCFLALLFVMGSSLKSNLFTSKKSLSKSHSNGWVSTSYLQVYILADTGKALARCNGCGSAAYSDSAAVHAAVGNSWALWRLYPGNNGQVAIQSVDTGKYLSRCNNCWSSAAYPDAAFVHGTDPANAYSNWLLVANSDGTYSFKADTGKYLARCNGCVTGGSYSDFAFVHASSNSDSWVRWKIQVA